MGILEIIGYILICIWAFYFARCLLAQYILYPLAAEIKRKYNEIQKSKNNMPLRKYSLFVLNPFWWSVTNVFKCQSDRQMVQSMLKRAKKFYSNSKR